MPTAQHIYPVDLIFMGVVLGFIVFGELVILSVRRQHRRDEERRQRDKKA
ncbi:MAG: hypothetical protein PVF51_00850 [Nitrospirota bacterium]|jgi:hypothetical protein